MMGGKLLEKLRLIEFGVRENECYEDKSWKRRC